MTLFPILVGAVCLPSDTDEVCTTVRSCEDIALTWNDVRLPACLPRNYSRLAAPHGTHMRILVIRSARVGRLFFRYSLVGFGRGYGTH